jgi:APA family basic amino acid/polyamine antiporter
MSIILIVQAKKERNMDVRRSLGLFDVSSIVVGSIVGADIYIASAITAGLVGPFSLIIWLIAGLCAVVIALVFAECSALVPRVGGPFAYVSAAFDDFWGFLAGWSLWIAEMLALPVFAIAFVNYFQYLVPLAPLQEVLVKGLFVFSLTAVNIVGIKVAGRVNDGLTLVKLMPLFILIGAGMVTLFQKPGLFVNNYTPMLPLGLQSVGTALVLIFWAYVGFELATLPADEVQNPERVIPMAIIIGMGIVMIFYLATNFIVYGVVNWQELAATKTPLILVGMTLLGSVGALIMTVGALFSVSGSNESGIIGTSRLSYAMAIDGLFPRVFANIHPGYRTPVTGLLIQGSIAFVLSLFSTIPGLISFSIFNLAFTFLLTCFGCIILQKESVTFYHRILPLIGIFICLFLIISSTWTNIIIGILVILAGLPLYIFFSPKEDIHHLKEMFLSEESIFVRRIEEKERFLANFIQMVHRLFHRLG